LAYIGSQPANKPVVASDLDPAVITGQTALAVAPADTDEFLISDAGTLKRIDASLIGGGGGLIFISSTNVTSNTAAVEFTGINSTYDNYKLIVTDLRTATDNVEIKIQVGNSTDGYYTNHYQRAAIGKESNGDTAAGSGAGDGVNGIYLTNVNLGNASDESMGFEANFVKPSTTDTHKLVYGMTGHINQHNRFTVMMFGGFFQDTVLAIDKFKVITSSGNISRGRFTLFGVANS
tara:strand:+ start:38 stop:739 length:702 start_codon:yes stop_codon:yes gene_type:complete